ncbi:MAG: tyrosine-protein phosphatase [Dehalococcoidia bacterium]|nr:tyrosine-protein phosphatase [Dehalococcoidia bacterium]
MTTGVPERHLSLEGCTNFRDLGGYRTADGRTTRWRTLFRSGDPSLMTTEDMERVRALGISTVLDFRSGSSIRLLVGTLSREARSYWPLAFEPEWVDQDLLARWPEASLSYMRHPSARAQLKAGIDALAGESSLPAVFHCSQGKDRTGMFAAIVLGVLGVLESDIAADFALSARYYDPENFRDLLAAVAAQGGEGAELAKRGARIMAMQAAGDPPGAEAMLTLLEGVRAEYGSVRDYALGIGVAEGCLATLEEALLVPEATATLEPPGMERDR